MSSIAQEAQTYTQHYEDGGTRFSRVHEQTRREIFIADFDATDGLTLGMLRDVVERTDVFTGDAAITVANDTDAMTVRVTVTVAHHEHESDVLS